MTPELDKKIDSTVERLRTLWATLKGRIPFVAFSTGKDSLAMAAMLYEAVAPEKPPCIYSHHDFEFPECHEYLKTMEGFGFKIEVARPFLSYFELMDRGIGFLTRHNAWCVPMLVGTALLEWLRCNGANSPSDGVMFRGISGSEYGKKFHRELEIYERLELPTINPMLDFTKEEILQMITERYNLPLNPIYDHLPRTYCICCYTSADPKRVAYSKGRFPAECKKYYRQIEEMLFDSGLVECVAENEKMLSREEKLERHGFVHWRRRKEQERVGAIRLHNESGVFSYLIRDADWIDEKHLEPLRGKWVRKGNEIRFFEVPESLADTVIKRMINCIDCGFCTMQCMRCRTFDHLEKRLAIHGCTQCGECLSLKHCMGWQHRFWRRVIREKNAMGKGHEFN